MGRRKTAPKPVKLARTLAVRSVVIAVALAAAALFASQIEIRCQRVEGSVDCRVRQGTAVPGTSVWLPVSSREVHGLREVRWRRVGSGGRARARTFSQGGDTLLMIGATEIEVPWREASAPLGAFLRAESRKELTATQPMDPRGWLVSRALFAFILLILIDTAILIALGQKRIYELVGTPPDPDAPLPDTPLARFGQYAALALGLGVLAFFAFGHRYFGPTAESKVKALTEAAEKGDLAALEAALQRNVWVDVVDPRDGGTALHAAARLETSALLRRLLDAGASAEVYDLSSRTPLMIASGRSDIDGVRALLERGADPSAMDESGWTPLRRAAESARLDVVELLLEAGADPLAQGPHGWTPLHTAAAHGGPAIARRLVEAGADPTLRNENGHLPGDLASFTDADGLLEAPDPANRRSAAVPLHLPFK